MKKLNRVLLALIVPMAVGIGAGLVAMKATSGNAPLANDVHNSIVIADNTMNTSSDTDSENLNKKSVKSMNSTGLGSVTSNTAMFGSELNTNNNVYDLLPTTEDCLFGVPPAANDCLFEVLPTTEDCLFGVPPAANDCLFEVLPTADDSGLGMHPSYNESNTVIIHVDPTGPKLESLPSDLGMYA